MNTDIKRVIDQRAESSLETFDDDQPPGIDDTPAVDVARKRKALRKLRRKKDYRSIFMCGWCQVYAIVLQEKLGLPLFYVSEGNHDDHAHIFAMKGEVCFDYDGKKGATVVAKRYSDYSDTPCKAITPTQIRERLRQNGIADLEHSVLRLARWQFKKRKHLYG